MPSASRLRDQPCRILSAMAAALSSCMWKLTARQMCQGLPCSLPGHGWVLLPIRTSDTVATIVLSHHCHEALVPSSRCACQPEFSSFLSSCSQILFSFFKGKQNSTLQIVMISHRKGRWLHLVCY